MIKRQQAPINFEQVDSIPHKKTVAFVNNFVINTTQFLNRFSYLCEQKLSKVSKDLQRLEFEMALLDAKLASIPGLENVTPESMGVQVSAAPAVTAPAPGQQHREEVDDDEYFGDDEPKKAAPVARPAEEPVEQQPTSGGLTLKDDPRYQRYFKMLKLGVHASAIRQKMMMDGIDPDLIDTPDAPSDYKGPLDGGAENAPAAQPEPSQAPQQTLQDSDEDWSGDEE